MLLALDEAQAVAVGGARGVEPEDGEQFLVAGELAFVVSEPLVVLGYLRRERLVYLRAAVACLVAA